MLFRSRRWNQNFEQLAAGEGLMPFRQDRPDFFLGSGKRDKDHLSLVSGDSLAPIGDLRDGKLDRTGTGRSRKFQYQLSFRSAGGTGSTWPVSCAGIFIDLVGIKKVPISMAPTPVSITMRDKPWVTPSVYA